MIAKTLALFALVAVASANVVYDHRIDDLGTIGAQSEQTVRGFNGFGGPQTVSHQTKAVDSAYSSVRKHDTRVINPSVYAHAPVYGYQQAVAAPVAYHGAVAAPVAYHGAAYHGAVAAPVAATSGQLLGVRYSSFPQAASYHFDSPVLGHFAY